MPIVTVSRLVGSFGDIVAAIVARKMGLGLISRDRVHALAQSCDPEYSDVCRVYESEHGPRFFQRLFFDRPSYRSLFEALTYEEASRGNVVIVGRGAQIVLQGVEGVFRCRVVAPESVRIPRIMERFSFTRAEAQDYVRELDDERKKLERAIFGKDPADWALYDVIINTEYFDAASSSEIVITAVGKKPGKLDEPRVLQGLKNLAVAKRVETIIRKRLTAVVARNVEIEADPDGNFRLTGRIRSYKEKAQCEEIANEYIGDEGIENDLKVTELSFGF